MWSEEEDIVVNSDFGRTQWKRDEWEVEDSDSSQRSEFILFVSGLPLYTSEEDLQKLFVQFGPVTKPHVVHSKNTGRHNQNTTYGFISFYQKEDGVAAIEKLNDQQYNGHTLLVTWSKNTQKKNAVSNQKDCSLSCRSKNKVSEEDENNLYNLIEVYTRAKSSRPDDLPDLHQLLHELQKLPNKCSGPYQNNDCEVTINLKDVHRSFRKSLIKMKANSTKSQPDFQLATNLAGSDYFH